MVFSRLVVCIVPLSACIAAAAAHSRRQSAFLGGNSPNDDDGSLGKLKLAYPYYHTTVELDKEIHRLEKVCQVHLEVTREEQDEVSLTVARIRNGRGEGNGTKTNRAFFLFGEHSRELISPESGLHLLRQLCGDAEMKSGQDRDELLATTDFMLLLNANPRSRKAVEQGNYCLRTNPSGVDLNRNWDEKFSSQGDGAETNPGPHPFSEPETKIVKRLVEDFKPTTFFTIHSGTRGMYMPWAYDMEHIAQRNEPSMRRILQEVDAKHCQCPFGAAGKEVGYSCPGTSLDWVYDKLQTPYAFAYEIYGGDSPDIGSDSELSFRFKEQQTAAAIGSDAEIAVGASLLQLGAQSRSGILMSEKESPEFCFSQFNPDTKERYASAVENWAAAYVETLQLVTQDLRTSSDESKVSKHHV